VSLSLDAEIWCAHCPSPPTRPPASRFEAFESGASGFESCDGYSSCADALPSAACDVDFGATRGCDCEGRALDLDHAVIKASASVTAKADVKNAVCYTEGIEVTTSRLSPSPFDSRSVGVASSLHRPETAKSSTGSGAHHRRRRCATTAASDSQQLVALNRTHAHHRRRRRTTTTTASDSRHHPLALAHSNARACVLGEQDYLTPVYTSDESETKWLYYGSNEGVLVNYPGFLWGHVTCTVFTRLSSGAGEGRRDMR
jgi:hypothetical protein